MPPTLVQKDPRLSLNDGLEGFWRLHCQNYEFERRAEWISIEKV